jgi:YgiT-type zinc finger domain-containing protein
VDRRRLPDCLGHYEEAHEVYAVEVNGEPFVVSQVPMQVCDFCGDTLLTIETVRRLERLREHPPRPLRSIPLYSFNAAEIDEGTEAKDAVVARYA